MISRKKANVSRCEKIGYRDRIAAELALLSTHKNGQKRYKNEKRAYRCPGCYKWHLTSKARWKRS